MTINNPTAHVVDIATKRTKFNNDIRVHCLRLHNKVDTVDTADTGDMPIAATVLTAA